MSQNPPGQPQPQPLYFMDFNDTFINQLALAQSTAWQFDHKNRKVTLYFPFGTTIVLKGDDYQTFTEWRERTIQSAAAAVVPATAEEAAAIARKSSDGRGIFKRP